MMKLIFTGTGASCAIPVIGHLGFGSRCACQDAIDNPLGFNHRNNVSLLIHLPSEVVRATREFKRELISTEYHEESEGDNYDEYRQNSQYHVNVLIDCGKTFRQSFFRVLAPHRIHYVDALLLTHGHSDAMQGVGELCQLHAGARSLLSSSSWFCKDEERPEEVDSAPDRTVLPRHLTQSYEGFNDQKKTKVSRDITQSSTRLPAVLHHAQIPTYLTDLTLKNIQVIVPDLVQHIRHLGRAPEDARAYNDRIKQFGQRSVDHGVTECPVGLDIFQVPEDAPVRLYVHALEGIIPMYSLPVEHGENYISLGYVFGRGTAFKSPLVGRRTESLPVRADSTTEPSCVVYISDVTSIPEPSMRFLLDLVKIDVLIFDLLAGKGRSSLSHTCWDDIMPYLRVLTPKRTFFVGMFCSLEHQDSNVLWERDIQTEKTRIRDLLERLQFPLPKHQESSQAAQKGDQKYPAVYDCASIEERCEDLKERWQRFLSIGTPQLAYDGSEIELPL